MCQGGISRLVTLVLIERSTVGHPHTSERHRRDRAGRWQVWHERWRIGATSLVNVTGVWFAAAPLCWADAAPAMARKARTVGMVRTIVSSSGNRQTARQIVPDGGPTVNNQFRARPCDFGRKLGRFCTAVRLAAYHRYGGFTVTVPVGPRRERSRLLTMTANKQTVERYMDGFRRTDRAQILSCLTDDVEWLIPGAFHGGA
jgi:hypothetical protein